MRRWLERIWSRFRPKPSRDLHAEMVRAGLHERYVIHPDTGRPELADAVVGVWVAQGHCFWDFCIGPFAEWDPENGHHPRVPFLAQGQISRPDTLMLVWAVDSARQCWMSNRTSLVLHPWPQDRFLAVLSKYDPEAWGDAVETLGVRPLRAIA